MKAAKTARQIKGFVRLSFSNRLLGQSLHMFSLVAAVPQFSTTQVFRSLSSSGEKVATDRAGNSYVVGRFVESVNLGTTNLTGRGSDDIFVVKSNPKGEVTWATVLGGTNSDMPGAIAVDHQGGVCVAGAVDFIGTSTLVIAKYDEMGRMAWRVESTSGTAYATSIAVDRKGNVLVAGWFDYGFQFGGTNFTTPSLSESFFLLKLDPNGQLLWARQEEHAVEGNFNPANGVSVDAHGNVYLVGMFTGTLSFGQTVSLVSNRPQDVYIAKFARDGQPQWARAGGSPGLDYGRSIATSPSGISYVTGTIHGSGQFGSKIVTSIGESSFVAKYGPRGKASWVRGTRSLSRASAYDVAMDSGQRAYVTGEFTGTVQFGNTEMTSSPEQSDLFVWSLNRLGRSRWATQDRSDSGHIRGSGIAVRAKDDAVITGDYAVEVEVGNTNIYNGPRTGGFAVGLSKQHQIGH